MTYIVSSGALNSTHSLTPSGVFAPHIRDFPYHLHGVTSFYRFFGFLHSLHSLVGGVAQW